MEGRKPYGANAVCKHEEEGYCCFRYRAGLPNPLCNILSDATFPDGYCHFRKRSKYGENEYDKMKRGDEIAS